MFSRTLAVLTLSFAAVLPTALVLTALVAAAPRMACAQVSAPNERVPPGIDPKAEALLQKAADRLNSAPSFSGRVTTISRIPASGKIPAKETRSVRTFRLQKPYLIYQEGADQAKGADSNWVTTPTVKYVSDGKMGVHFYVKDKVYRKIGVTPADVPQYYLNFGGFFNANLSHAQQMKNAKARGELVSLTMAPDATFAGVACSVVAETVMAQKKPNETTYQTINVYLGKKDGLIHGYHAEAPPPGGSSSDPVWVTDTLVTDMVVGDKIPTSVFAVDLTGYKEYVEPKPLAAGTMAPDFTAYDKDGKAVKLSDFKGKIVVLDFWATWCVPCMASLPHTTEVAKKMADKGVVVLAVNVWDDKKSFDKWLPTHPEFSPLMFVIDTTPGEGQDVATKLYKVKGIPTQYVIDRDGKVATSFEGYDGPTDELEKAITKSNTKASVSP